MVENLIEKVTEIVRHAAELMKPENVEVTQKGNASNFVTTADLNVQEFLKKELLALLPGSVFVGEEEDGAALSSGMDGGKNCSKTDESENMCPQYEYIWVVDPIDGTSNFIRDIGMSAISVGLLKWGEPYAGVIYQPYRNEMFWAMDGQGAYLNGKRIYVSDRDFKHGHLCSAMSTYHKGYAPMCFHIIEKVYADCDDLRRLGSAAVELAYLAAGRVELYFEIRLFPWDVAAGIVLIKEAGGYTEMIYQEGFPLDRPVALVGANTKENFEKMKEIVCGEMKSLPY